MKTLEIYEGQKLIERVTVTFESEVSNKVRGLVNRFGNMFQFRIDLQTAWEIGKGTIEIDHQNYIIIH